jgi:hypothetical protein
VVAPARNSSLAYCSTRILNNAAVVRVASWKKGAHYER